MDEKKITKEDLTVLTDEEADVHTREEALTRLAFWEPGKYRHLEATVAGLLDHADPILRGGALKTLLAGWKVGKYVDAAVRILHEDRDPDWIARADAAFALTAFVRRTGERRDEILREVTKAIRNDPAWEVREACYENLLDTIAPEHSRNFSVPFDPDTDVDWELLAPYVT